MNKVFINIVVFMALLCLAVQVSAVTIPDPLNIGPNPNGFGILLGRIATAVGNLVAVIGTIMLIVAGILYLTSAGSPERTGTAKKALIYAIVGIAIGLAATAITQIILQILNPTT